MFYFCCWYTSYTQAHQELHLAGDMKIKKGLLQVHQHQKEDQENVRLLINGAEWMVKKDMEKAEVYNAFFTMVFIVMSALQWSLLPEACG